MSILASLVDSVVDLGAQSVLYFSNRDSKRTNLAPNSVASSSVTNSPCSSAPGNGMNTLYPAGRARIEPVGVVIAASVMAMASIEVVRESVEQIVGGRPSVAMTGEANVLF